MAVTYFPSMTLTAFAAGNNGAAAADENQPGLVGTGLYDIWVAGVQVTDENKDNILADSTAPEGNTGTAAYDPDTNVLTLTGVNITKGYYQGGFADGYIYSAVSGLTVQFVGTNSIDSTADTAAKKSTYAGIYADASLTVQGAEGATLDITAPVGIGTGADFGLTVENLTINDAIIDSGFDTMTNDFCLKSGTGLTVTNCNITAKTDLTKESTGANYKGLAACQSDSGDITFDGSTLTTGKSDGVSAVLTAAPLSAVRTDGSGQTVTVTGSTIRSTVTDMPAFEIADSSSSAPTAALTFANSTINATTDTGYAIDAAGTVTVQESTLALTTTANTAFRAAGTVNISDGSTVTADSVTGIAAGAVNISGGSTVTANATTGIGISSGSTIGIEGENTSVTASSTGRDAIYAAGAVTIKDSAEVTATAAADGIDADGDVTIDSATCTVTDSKGAAAVYSKGNIVVNNSTVDVTNSGTKSGGNQCGFTAEGDITFSGTDNKVTSNATNSPVNAKGSNGFTVDGGLTTLKTPEDVVAGYVINAASGINILSGKVVVDSHENNYKPFNVTPALALPEKVTAGKPDFSEFKMTIEPAWSVTYDANGGTGDVPEKQLAIIDYTNAADVKSITIPESPTPVSADGTFIGWAESDTATEAGYFPKQVFTPSYDMTLYAVYSKNFTFGTESTDGGNYTANPSTIKPGDSITLTETPAEGYEFVKWERSDDGGTTYADAGTSAPSQTFTYITEQTKIRPVFKLKTFKVRTFASPAAGGTAVIADGDTTVTEGAYDYGTSHTLTAVPNAGYDFISWTSGGNIVSQESTFVTDSLKGNMTYTANFVKQTFTFTPGDAKEGKGTASPASQTVAYGDTINLTAVPAEGYMFDRWYRSDDAGASYTEAGNKNPGVFENITQDTKIYPNFIRITENVVVNIDPVSDLSNKVTGAGAYEYGDEVTLTAVPGSEYNFVKWIENGAIVTTDASFTLTSVKENHTYKAVFEKKTWEFNADKAVGGTAEVTPASVTSGGSITLTATPDEGYDFIGWMRSDDSGTTYADAGTDNPQIFDNILTTTKIQPVFKLKTFEITASADPAEGGTVAGAGTYDWGTEAALAATPAVGYDFVRWMEGSDTVGTEAALKVTVKAAHAYVAVFKKQTFKVTYDPDASKNGKVTMTGGGDATEYGSSVTFTETPDYGYVFVKWTDNGKDAGTGSSYTIDPVTGAHDVTAVFKKIPSASFKDGDIIVLHSDLDYSKALDIEARSRDNTANLQLWDANGSSAQEFIVVENGDGTYSFAPYCSGRYLDVAGAGTADGTNIRQYDVNGTAAQSWTVMDNTDESVSFESSVGKGCMMDVMNGWAAAGTNVRIWQSNGTSAQKFRAEIVGTVPYKTGNYTVGSAVGTNLMLDVLKAGTENGTNVVINGKTGTETQTFRLMYGPEGSYRFITFCGKAVDVAGGRKAICTNIQEYAVNYSKAQNWFIEETKNGTEQIVSEVSGLCMNVDNAGTADGTNVQCYTDDGTAAGEWFVSPVA